jgi:hypothetical protein
MSEQNNTIATRSIPAETQRTVEREAAVIEASRRPPTMIPGAANPRVIEDGANFYRRLYRPHRKRWVAVSVWIFFVLIPALMALFWVYAMLRRLTG